MEYYQMTILWENKPIILLYCYNLIQQYIRNRKKEKNP